MDAAFVVLHCFTYPWSRFGVWLITAPVLIVTFVLGIISICPGGSLQGVLILLATLIMVLVFVFVAPLLTTGTAIYAAKAIEERNPSGVSSGPIARNT